MIKENAALCKWPSCREHGQPFLRIWDHECDGPPLDKRYTGWQDDFLECFCGKREYDDHLGCTCPFCCPKEAVDA